MELLEAPKEGDDSMKKLTLLLSVLLMLFIMASSPIFASPPSTSSRIESVLAFFNNYFPHFSRFFCFHMEIQSINGEGNDVRLKGDADDTANGRDGDIRDGSKKEKVKSNGLSFDDYKNRPKDMTITNGLR